jgi:hypothetical protein
VTGDEEVEEEGFAGLIADAVEVRADVDAFGFETMTGGAEVAEDKASGGGIADEIEADGSSLESGLTFGGRGGLEEGFGEGEEFGIGDAEEGIALGDGELMACDGAGGEGGDDLGDLGGTGDEGLEKGGLVGWREESPLIRSEHHGGEVGVGRSGGVPCGDGEEGGWGIGLEEVGEVLAGGNGIELGGEADACEAEYGEGFAALDGGGSGFLKDAPFGAGAASGREGGKGFGESRGGIDKGAEEDEGAGEVDAGDGEEGFDEFAVGFGRDHPTEEGAEVIEDGDGRVIDDGCLGEESEEEGAFLMGDGAEDGGAGPGLVAIAEGDGGEGGYGEGWGF